MNPKMVGNDESQSKPLTAKDFLSLVKSEPKSEEEEQAYAHFSTFLARNENLMDRLHYGENFEKS